MRGVRKGKYRLREVGTGLYEVYEAETDELIGYIECPPEATSPEECEFKPIDEVSKHARPSDQE